MDSTSIKRRMKPVLFPQVFLEKKIQRKWQMKDTRSKFLCLTKYFPRYYKRLELYDESLRRSIQFKIKQLKIVNEFSCNRVSNHKKTFKKLFQGCRKTLKNLPSSDGDQDLNLCLFFPKLKAIDLEGHRSYFSNKYPNFFHYWIDFGDEDTENFKWMTLFYWKVLKRSYGYFWAGNRFIENLKTVCETDAQLIILNKLNNLKKFLSSLKILAFTLNWNNDNGSNLSIRLMKNNNFLQHVTHLRIKSSGEFCIDWESLQQFIKCHPQLSFLSFPIHKEHSPKSASKDLGLDLNCFPKLQALEIDVYDLETLIRRVEFSPYIREITLAFSRDMRQSFKRILSRTNLIDDVIPQIGETLECIDDENGEVEEIFQGQGADYEGEDTKDWEGFEQSKLWEVSWRNGRH